MATNNKLLLVGVFGPYGVKDAYAEGLGMQMELMNNQITREQNIHSLRQHYWTLPLYLLAENISVPTVVLDFPLWDDFVEELMHDYTHVGINFIVPNVLKAKRMAEYIRTHYPAIKIILGGYGTIIPELTQIMPFDALCQGEGVTWLREYFGEEPNAPIAHPIIQNPVSQSIYGFRSVPNSSVIMPGVGCKNGCEFCITSHKFGKKYIPLLPTGKDIFDACEKIYRVMKATEFFIMDENFLKQPERARQLLQEMEKHQRPFTFELFSSAEAIKGLGVDFLVRMGVRMIWVGVESKANSHTKTQGIDLKVLVSELQGHGISINTSAILFLDHHTDETIQEDIDWTISLGADMTQFMNYTAYPTTTLYDRLKKEGKIKDLPYRFQSGQGELNWVHPHITDPKKHYEYTRAAFQKKYRTQGPAILNMAITAINGYRQAQHDLEQRMTAGLVWNPDTLRYEPGTITAKDSFFELRIQTLRKMADGLRPVLLVNQVFAPNNEARKKAHDTEKLYNETLGKPSTKDILMASGLLSLAAKAAVQHSLAKLRGEETVVIQPPMNRVSYRLDSISNQNPIVGTPISQELKSSPFQGFSNFKLIDPLFFKNPLSWFIDQVKITQVTVEKVILRIGNELYSQ